MKIFDSMKKFIILFAIASVLFTGCRLDNGSTSGHDYKRMESYTYRMFNDNVLRPAAEINIFIELDRYIKATEVEKQSDEFKWHRQMFFHEDDFTFAVRGLGTVNTYGKSFFDEGVIWKSNVNYERVGEKSWNITFDTYNDTDNKGKTNTTVTFEGRNEEGKNVFKVEVLSTDECLTSYSGGDKVTAIISTPEGPMTIINPEMIYGHDVKNSELPEGSGVFMIETQRNGKILDLMQLKYDASGKNLTFKCE